MLIRLLAACALLTLLPLAGSATVILVDLNGGGDYLTIQEGIDAASEGDTVLVAPGTYTGEGNNELDFNGTNMTVSSLAGIDGTTIACADTLSGFHLHSGEDSTSVIEGFSIIEGVCGVWLEGAGAIVQDCRFELCDSGVACYSAAAIVRRSRFIGDASPFHELCGAYSEGEPAATFVDCVFEDSGGLRCRESPAIARRCQFFHCVGTNRAGGIGLWYSDAVIEDAVLHQCECTSPFGNLGIGIFIEGSSPVLDRVVVSECWQMGHSDLGSIYCQWSTPTLRNVIIFGSDGNITGSIFCNGSQATLENVTIVDDDGIRLQGSSSSVTAENSIIAFSGGPPIWPWGSGSPTATTLHSCSFANTGGDSLYGDHYENIFVDPLFCDWPAGDLTLHDDSPCLPAGNPWGVLMGASGAGGCGPSTGIQEEAHASVPFLLLTPAPMPSRGAVEIGYSIAEGGGVVEVTIFNVRGELVRTLVDAPGRGGAHVIRWDGTGESGEPVASGVYFLRGAALGVGDRETVVIVR